MLSRSSTSLSAFVKANYNLTLCLCQILNYCLLALFKLLNNLVARSIRRLRYEVLDLGILDGKEVGIVGIDCLSQQLSGQDALSNKGLLLALLVKNYIVDYLLR